MTVIERDRGRDRAVPGAHSALPLKPRRRSSVVQADAYEYAARMGGQGYDYAYVDIWHDVLDGVEMYLKMKRLEGAFPGHALSLLD